MDSDQTAVRVEMKAALLTAAWVIAAIVCAISLLVAFLGAVGAGMGGNLLIPSICVVVILVLLPVVAHGPPRNWP